MKVTDVQVLKVGSARTLFGGTTPDGSRVSFHVREPEAEGIRAAIALQDSGGDRVEFELPTPSAHPPSSE